MDKKWRQSIFQLLPLDGRYFLTVALKSSLIECLPSNIKNRFSCIARLKIHQQLENHRKELFSTELHWEIFCCITSYDYNFQKKLGHVTSPDSKMAGRDVSISHCADFVFLSISTLFWIGGFVTSFKATSENHRRPFKSQCYAHKVMRNVKLGNYLGTELLP